MSYSISTIFIHQGPSLKPKVDQNLRKQRKEAPVCCCRWPEKNKSPKRQRLPPTPSLLHLLGLPLHLLRSRPHHYALRDLANKYGPLVYLEVGQRPVAIITSPNIAKEVLRTHDPAYAERPKFMGSQILSGDIVFHQYDEYWKQKRALCISGLLSAKQVASLEHITEEETSAVIESIRGSRAPFNLTEKIYSYTFTVVCRAALGRVPVDKGEALLSIKKAVDLLGRLSVIDLFPSAKALSFMSLHKLKLQESRHQLERILEGLIDTEQGRSRDGGKHFVDVLLQLKESGELEYPLTDDNIKSLLLELFVAGTDTSSSVADWAMAELMKNPRVMAKAQNEIRQAFEGKKMFQECDISKLKYLKLVIMETLRLHPPFPLTFRSCREEVEVDGYHIPLNAVVIINTWAIGRDPTYWKNPDSFEPERFESSPVNFSGTHFEFIPFGSGKRMCPGKTFGLAQIEMLLAQLLYHFDWQLPSHINPRDLDMTDVGGIFVSRKNPLYLSAKPYS